MLDMYGLAALHLQRMRIGQGQTAWNEDDAMWFAPDGPTARGFRALTGMLRGLGSRGRAAPRLSEPMPRC